MTKLETVTEMEQSAFAGNWDKFKSFLAPDISYRCGNTAAFQGSEGVVDFMKELLRSRLALNDLKVRSAWESDDAVVMEFNMKAVRVDDGKNVEFPCLDIYRFGSDGKINDWRVHAIETTLIK
jgi:predicted SnoaL-like aldol condensation-catalyzing enzyme